MNLTSTRLFALALACLVLSTANGCGEDHEPGVTHDDMGSESGDKPAKTGDEPAQSVATKPATPAKLDHHTDIRGHCDLHTDFADDHACIPAPDPEDGFQIHIGPSDYNDPEQIAKFVMHPGQESSECFTYQTSNDKKIFYQTSMLSGRAGTHHIINTMYNQALPTGSFSRCADQQTALGSLPGASKPYMARGKIAPEYAHVGNSIPAHVTAQADMHYFNYTDHDILREVWINIYYVDESEITEEARLISGFGGLGWTRNPIKPGTDNVYKYSCPVKGNGHILSLLGHYHAHGKRFTASIKRAAGGVEKVFEMYDYLEPAVFQYNSVNENPPFSDNSAGAVSGGLELFDGDALLWECHVINDSDVGLTYTNFVNTGEMCNVWGTTTGVDAIRCYIQ